MLKRGFSFACLSVLLSGCSLVVSSTLDDKADSGSMGNDGGMDASVDANIDMNINDDMLVELDMDVADAEPDATFGSCDGLDDGSPCGPMGSAEYICLSSVCDITRCGDGYIDSVAGEECEDGNPNEFDGCEPSTCKYTCTTDEQCSDGEPCNGAESCRLTSHRCQGGTVPPDESVCETPSIRTGVCRDEICASAGCGDGTTDGSIGEECDDGNTMPDDGCEPDCQYSCESNSDCDDGDMCNGIESCEPTSHKCQAGVALSCDDAMDCTTDVCDPVSGCANILIDDDGDSYSAVLCGSGYATDCDDHDPSTYPGAPQMCGTVDHNCDGVTDTSGSVTCYPDNDDDGYPVMSSPVTMCACPDHTVPARPDGQVDCLNNNPGAFPGAAAYHTEYASCSFYNFTTGTCAIKNYDWNCNGEAELQYTSNSTGCFTLAGACLGSGWTGTSDPGCGVDAQYRSCHFTIVIGGGSGSCSGTLSTVRQGCR